MLNPLIEHWCEYLAAGGRSKGTISIRRSHATRAVRAIQKDETNIKTSDLLRYLSCKQWKPATRRSARAAVVGYFTYLHKAGYIVSNPAKDLPTVIQPRALPRPAGESEIRCAILAAAPRVQTMIELMAFCGLRRMEVAQVKSGDLITTSAGEFLRVAGKGGHSRHVPVPGYLAAKIRAAGGWLFPGNENGHLSAPRVGKLVSAALPDGVTPHQLRHRFATAAYTRSRDIRAVQELLGHAKLDTTMIYTAVAPEAVGSAGRTAWQLAG